MANITGIEGQREYSQAKRDNEAAQARLKAKNNAHELLEEGHEDAQHKLNKTTAEHTTAKAEFDGLDSKLKAAREAHATALKHPELVALQTQHESKLAAAENAHAEFAELHTKAGGTLNPDGTIATPAKTHDILRAERDAVAHAKEQARLHLYDHEPLQGEFEAAESQLTAAKEKLAAARTPGKGKAIDAKAVQDAQREVQLAERDVKIAKRARNGTDAYKEFDRLNQEKGRLDHLADTVERDYAGLHDAARRAGLDAKSAEAALHSSPLHTAANEARIVVTDLETKHTAAKTKLDGLETTLEGYKTDATKALHDLEGNTRAIERAEKHAGRAAENFKAAGKRWRTTKFFTKPVKWGAIAGGVAAIGALAYSALKPSGRGSDESLQNLKDQMAENEAKLQAMQSMQGQQPVMQAPMMMAATPQGPVANQYPPVMMVPANANVPATSITGAGVQYQGQLAAGQGPALA